MRCPKCGYISFDHVETCLKCKKDISGKVDVVGTTYHAAAPSFLKVGLTSTPEDSDGFIESESEQIGGGGLILVILISMFWSVRAAISVLMMMMMMKILYLLISLIRMMSRPNSTLKMTKILTMRAALNLSWRMTESNLMRS